MTAIRHRIGIVGLGFGASVQLPAFQGLAGVEVAAIADSGSGGAQTVAAQRGVAHAFGDWRALIRLPDIDIVSVATPPIYHAEIVQAALSAGKHVLCEKPFGLNAQQAKTMLDAARSSGLKHAVDLEFRMEPGIAVLRELVAKGAIGGILRVGVSWFTAGRASPDRAWSWQHSAEAGGGVLAAFGCHVLDYVEWICARPITHIFAQTQVLIHTRRDLQGRERAVTAEDSTDLMCRLDGGVVANIQVSNCYSFELGHRIEIYGEQGRLVSTHASPFGAEDVAVWIETDSDVLRPVAIQSFVSGATLPPRALPFQELARRFIAAIEGQPAQDFPTFERGVAVRRALDAAYESARTGAVCLVMLGSGE